MNGRASSITLAVLLTRIIHEWLCEAEACELARDANFMHSQFRSHQISQLPTFTLDKLYRGLSLHVLAHGVNIQPKDVPYNLEKSDKFSRVQRSASAFEDAIEERLLE